MKKNNLLFIMTDHQRADSIFMVQDGKEVTPNLNKLAKASTNFTRAYDLCPLCVPARTGLATGRFPTKNGVVLNQGSEPTDYKTIHHFLKEEGYKVGHVGVDHIRLNPELKESMDFDLFVGIDDYNEYMAAKGVSTKRAPEDATYVKEYQNGDFAEKPYSNSRVSTWKHGTKDHKDTYFLNKVFDFLEKDYEEPFALFVYLWAPHPPLFVPEEYIDMYNPENITLPDNVGCTAEGESARRALSAPRQLAEGVSMENWKKAWAAHLGLVTYADDLIGQIFDKFKEKNYWDKTNVVFTVDHGDHLGQHNMYQKMEMYEQAINIPLMFKVPGINGKMYDNPVSHLDVVPTLIDLCGLEKQDLDGDSLMPQIIDGKPLEEKMVYSQYSGNAAIGDIRRAVISKRYKYIYDELGTEELFNLEKDPLEMKNVAGDSEYEDILKEMSTACEKFFTNQNDWVKY